jgi:hypothetical protein
MTLTVFIALCLLGCGFMLYVLFQWIRDPQPNNATWGSEAKEQDRKQPHIVNSSKLAKSRVNVPTARDSRVIRIGQGTRRFESGLHHSERICYERIARSLTPGKKDVEEGVSLVGRSKRARP